MPDQGWRVASSDATPRHATPRICIVTGLHVALVDCLARSDDAKASVPSGQQPAAR